MRNPSASGLIGAHLPTGTLKIAYPHLANEILTEASMLRFVG
jgi:hypothetical protein